MGRLHVIPARESHLALILRRGPTRWYHLIRWNTQRDEFEHGAWIKGRIYEHSCDFSPDGQLVLYTVFKWSRFNDEILQGWTAVSRAPWLYAMALWPLGSTYEGGGQFTGPRTIWGLSAETTHPDFPIPIHPQFKVPRLHIAYHRPEPRALVEPVSEANWTGLDFAGNIIFTKGDLLYRRQNGEDTLVADFSGLTPDPQPAPEWATQPL